MKHNLRFYEEKGDTLTLKVTDLILDGNSLSISSTDQRHEAIDAFGAAERTLQFVVTVNLPAPLEQDEIPDILVECQRTKVRLSLPLISAGDGLTFDHESAVMPANWFAGKVVFRPRLLRKTAGDFLDIARGEPVEVVLHRSDPPGSNGFLRISYCNFDNDENVPQNAKSGAFFIQYEQASLPPTLYINNAKYSEEMFEIESRRSYRGKVGGALQAMLRDRVAESLCRTAVGIVLPLISEESTDDDLINVIDPGWAVGLAQAIADKIRETGLVSPIPSSDNVRIATLLALDEDPEKNSKIGIIASLLYGTGQETLKALGPAWDTVVGTEDF
jgi:hypothetical protein